MNREKVIRGIDICLNRFHCGADCPYYGNSSCQERLREDVLALLKEQEAEISFLKGMQLKTIHNMSEGDIGDAVAEVLRLKDW